MKFTNTVKNNYRSLIINLSKVEQRLIQVRISSLNLNSNYVEPKTAPKNNYKKVIHKSAHRLKLKKKKQKERRKRRKQWSISRTRCNEIVFQDRPSGS